MLFKVIEVEEILTAKGELAALAFASKLNCLGEYRDAIQKGYAASKNPTFYREIGTDPDTLYRSGVEAIHQLIAANHSTED